MATTVGKYHTNDSGKTLPCTAGVRDCQFIHGATPAEAAERWQAKMQEELLPPAAKRLTPQELLSFYRASSLKTMNDSQLAESIMLESSELGFDMKKIAESIALASELHGKQFRKGRRGTVESPPYIEHPLRNSLRLLRLGTREQDVVISSMLHDTIEDGSDVFVSIKQSSSGKSKELQGLPKSGKSEEESRELLHGYITARFGKRSAEIVLAVTNPIVKKPVTQEEKHRNYVAHLRASILHDSQAYLVKISDFIDNATGLHHGVTTMKPEKIQPQARKYLLAVPVFQEGLQSNNIQLPERSKEVLRKSMTETARRLQKIAAGWDGIGKI